MKTCAVRPKAEGEMKDRVFETSEGWCCTVGGETHGTWMSKAIAKAGMQVEQRRIAARAATPLSNEQLADLTQNLS